MCGATNQGLETAYATTAVNSTDYTDFPYKLFTKPQNTLNRFSAVCVKSCPKSMDKSECKPNSENPECKQMPYDTAPVYTYCLPEGDDMKELITEFYQQMNEKFNFGKYLADLQICWQGMAIMCFVTLVIAVVYIFLLKWITKPLLYVSMVLILACFILLGGWCWIKKSTYDPVKEEKNY